jgi:hypothetical protein
LGGEEMVDLAPDARPRAKLAVALEPDRTQTGYRERPRESL